MTVADLKRRLQAGTRLHITNHYIPADTREAEVLKATSANLVLTHPRAGDGGSWLPWPKASGLVENTDGTVTVLGGAIPGRPPAKYIPDQPFLTLRWL